MESPLAGSGELEAAQRNELFWGNGSLCLCIWHAQRRLTECWMKSGSQVGDLAWDACPPTRAGFRRRIRTRTGSISRAVCPGLYLPEEGASFQPGRARDVKTEAGGQGPQVGQQRWEERKGKRSHHLPGEPQAADRGVVQSHDHGVEGQQVLVLLAAAGVGGGSGGGQGAVATPRRPGFPSPARRTHMAAILMNFLSSCARLPAASQSRTSVATQWVTSLQRCSRSSRLAVSRRPRSPWNT